MPPLSATGARVRVHTPEGADIPPYRRAVEASRERLAPWNPVNPGDLAYHLSMQSSVHRTFLIRASEPEGDHDVVGKVNVTNIVRRRQLGGWIGYDSYDPYAGRGLFAEGLRLVVDLAFTGEPRGLGLHRLDAGVQPGNVRSAGMLRSIGFRRRGSEPAYLWLADGQGREAWRDHVHYGLTAEQWPAPAWAAHVPARPVIVLLADRAVVEDPPAYTVSRTLALEAGVPLLRVHGLDPAVGGPQLAERLADAVTGAVVLTDLPGEVVVAALTAADAAQGAIVTALDSIGGAADVVRLALDARAAAGIDA
ncbi:GNAT family N-acetyltransferase [Agilicoccus flavus]|uniref:GNAT family N-acetyltransferase n=1 Tax=Agilicoccus flavus TaxID=2775968 RepID=UPI001CF68ACE|nr:GNAT family N-acetyltransferase [Agilicoccus flavus]